MIQTHFISKHFNLAQNPPFGPQPVYDKGMKNEIAVPVYSSLEALLAAETGVAPVGPFGPKRSLNLGSASERKLMTLWASGYLVRCNGSWELSERGQDLYYVV